MATYEFKYTLINNNTEYAVSGYTGTLDSNITIPSTHDGKYVTSISNYALYKCTSLTSVVIPNSVTSIGTEAFRGCSSLSSVVIGDSVTSIGAWAFYGCNSLTSVNYLGTIDNWVQISFSDYYSNPIYYAEKLYINNELVTEANITTATKINNYAFYNCKSLKSVVIGNSVTSIGYEAFRDCTSLTSIEIPNSVTSIGVEAFFGCKSLTSIVIPDSVTSIGTHAFYQCTALEKVVLSNKITNLNTSMFVGCTNLKNITIPSSVTSIGSHVFYGCTSLTSINILSKEPANLVDSNALNTQNSNTKLYCYSSALDGYKTATNWNSYANKFVAADVRLSFITSSIAQKNYFASKEEVNSLADSMKIEADSELSLESENPVQNKVITEKFEDITEEIENLKNNSGGGGTLLFKHTIRAGVFIFKKYNPDTDTNEETGKLYMLPDEFIEVITTSSEAPADLTNVDVLDVLENGIIQIYKNTGQGEIVVNGTCLETPTYSVYCIGKTIYKEVPPFSEIIWKWYDPEDWSIAGGDYSVEKL